LKVSDPGGHLKSKSYPMLFGLVAALLIQVGNADFQPALHAAGKVNLLRVPNGGLQPQAALDERGILHLVYFTGEPQRGDIYYIRRDAGKTEFTSPVRINSEPGSAVAVGTIRGAQLAIGKNGRVHVAWNGRHKPDGYGAPMLYARMSDARTGFDPQINVMQF
jgi:hypothetical protein